MKSENVNRKIRIEKIVLNSGCGKTGNVEHAKLILERVSGCKAVITKTRKRSTFNVPKGKDIGCKVTIRKNTKQLLRRFLEAKENVLSASSFDRGGNFSFGIKEYIDMPDMEYDPKLGVMGFDVCVRLMRPGYRITRKKLSSRIGKKHVIKKEEAINFIQDEFNIKVK